MNILFFIVYSLVGVVSGLIDDVSPFYPNCYSGDTQINSINVSIAIDYGTFLNIARDSSDSSASKKLVREELNKMLSPVRLLYIRQLNLRIDLQDIYIGDINSPEPFSMTQQTCQGAMVAFSKFMSFDISGVLSNASNWMFVSDCFKDVTGNTYIGSICRNRLGVSNRNWLTFAHEFGHSIGAYHTFQNGKGLTGGIMDYGTGLYNGSYQFHPYNRPEICPVLNNAKCIQRNVSLCGDGIMEPSETCENLVPSKECRNCRLVNNKNNIEWNNIEWNNIECSTRNNTFIVRSEFSQMYVSIYDDGAWSHKDCCRRFKLSWSKVYGFKFSGPKTMCNGGLGVCSMGQCQRTCSKYLSRDTKICAFDASGCNSLCYFRNKCSLIPIASIVPDNTTCFISGRTLGFCLSGFCLSGHYK